MSGLGSSLSALFRSITQTFLLPAFRQLIGSGAVKSQLLRFLLALLLAPIALFFVSGVLLPESERSSAFLGTLVLVLVFGLLGLISSRFDNINDAASREYRLDVEVFENDTKLDHARNIEIFVRGMISDEKYSSSGIESWNFGSQQIGNSVTITARRKHLVSDSKSIHLIRENVKVELVLNEKKETTTAFESSDRKPPFFR